MSDSQQAASRTLSKWVRDLGSTYLVEWHDRNNNRKKACWVPSLYTDYLAGRRGFVVPMENFRCRFEGANCYMCIQETARGSDFSVFSAKHLAQQRPGSRIDQSEIQCLNQIRILAKNFRRPSVLSIIQEQAKRYINVDYLESPLAPIMNLLDDFQVCGKCHRLVCPHRVGSIIKIQPKDEHTMTIPLKISLSHPSRQLTEPLEVPRKYFLAKSRGKTDFSPFPVNVFSSLTDDDEESEARTSTQ